MPRSVPETTKSVSWRHLLTSIFIMSYHKLGRGVLLPMTDWLSAVMCQDHGIFSAMVLTNVILDADRSRTSRFLNLAT